MSMIPSRQGDGGAGHCEIGVGVAVVEGGHPADVVDVAAFGRLWRPGNTGVQVGVPLDAAGSSPVAVDVFMIVEAGIGKGVALH